MTFRLVKFYVEEKVKSIYSVGLTFEEAQEAKDEFRGYRHEFGEIKFIMLIEEEKDNNDTK